MKDFDILMGFEEPNIDSLETKQIPQYPEYRAGVDGSIWSQRSNGVWFTLKPLINKKTGRKHYFLSGRRQVYGSHLVLMAFVGPRPEGLEACHENGNCGDDSKKNLRWDTRTGNMDDTYIHGTRMCGDKHPNSKITDEEAEEIVLRRHCGEDSESLALEYDLHVSRINAIARGERTKLP